MTPNGKCEASMRGHSGARVHSTEEAYGAPVDSVNSAARGKSLRKQNARNERTWKHCKQLFIAQRLPALPMNMRNTISKDQ
eukprot:3233599-Amphidinium_carterae.1